MESDCMSYEELKTADIKAAAFSAEAIEELEELLSVASGALVKWIESKIERKKSVWNTTFNDYIKAKQIELDNRVLSPEYDAQWREENERKLRELKRQHGVDTSVQNDLF